MKVNSRIALLALGAFALGGCTPDWATSNSTPFILEIASISSDSGELPILSDVQVEGSVFNDEAEVVVNVFRKNNNGDLSTSPVEHVYLERYEVRYFRTDGRNTEGVDVPFRITGPMGNLRFHTAGPGGGGEVQLTTSITIVRHQAKVEPPLRNLRGVFVGDTDSILFGGSGILTTIAEITIHGRTVQGGVLQAVGRAQVTFADFADADAEPQP